jgi:hypothetical protein
MPARTSPEKGDVLVGQETRAGTVVYILRTAPGIDQYLLRTREEAVGQAVTFAERQDVRAWMVDEGNYCVALTRSRMVEPVRMKRERPKPGGLRPAGG